MNVRQYLLPFVCVLFFTSSCKYTGKSGSHGPIVLGDSADIVTETDSQNLKDFVPDINPTIPSSTETQEDTAAKPQPTPAADTAARQPDPPKAADPAPASSQATPQDGLNVPFKDVTILIPNIDTKTYRNQNLQRVNGASYQLINGNLNGNQIKVISGDVTNVSERYQTVIVIKNDLGELPLDALSTTTDWQSLKKKNNSFYISGLAANSLEYTRASAAAIRNAVLKATRAHHMSRRKAQEWMESVRRVHATNQRPLTVVLSSVMWRIEGKNAHGRPYQKQVRIDLPME